jgi:hypothetical protein
MNIEERMALTRAFFKMVCDPILERKGRASNSNQGFYDAAWPQFDHDHHRVWWDGFFKQVNRLGMWIFSREDPAEPLEEMYADIINYALIGVSMAVADGLIQFDGNPYPHEPPGSDNQTLTMPEPERKSQPGDFACLRKCYEPHNVNCQTCEQRAVCCDEDVVDDGDCFKGWDKGLSKAHERATSVPVSVAEMMQEAQPSHHEFSVFRALYDTPCQLSPENADCGVCVPCKARIVVRKMTAGGIQKMQDDSRATVVSDPDCREDIKLNHKVTAKEERSFAERGEETIALDVFAGLYHEPCTLGSGKHCNVCMPCRTRKLVNQLGNPKEEADGKSESGGEGKGSGGGGSCESRVR